MRAALTCLDTLRRPTTRSPPPGFPLYAESSAQICTPAGGSHLVIGLVNHILLFRDRKLFS
jgi:hypothetical protein